ncbi:hypothetical protein HDU98_011723 [Podochytrium sp. JEL0797]|nr:hypothetical protein HDU98_011723 [Podochytrium sp. JEL0797]
MDTLSEFDKSAVLSKQRACAATTEAALDGVLALLEDVRAQLVAGRVAGSLAGSLADTMPGTLPGTLPDAAAKLALLPGALRTFQNTSLDAHKSLHGAANKVAKAVDKRFKPLHDNLWNPHALDTKTDTLADAIALHLVRDGRFEIANHFANEASREMPNDAEFHTMFTIMDHIKAFDLHPLAQWIDVHRAELAKAASDLEFAVVRLQFLKLLFGVAGVCVGDRDSALQYAQAKFTPFKNSHLKGTSVLSPHHKSVSPNKQTPPTEIQKLMCCLLYTKNIADSPYKDLTDTTAWTDLSVQFTRDFCLLLNLPAESPLHTCISAGVSALPTIIKMSSILKEQSGLEWSSQGELPVEIPLLDRQRFHSVFACPVSKELGTKENPPMMMVCGHVVCKESLLRLGKGNMAIKFKCPYCPSEGKGDQAMRIYF